MPFFIFPGLTYFVAEQINLVVIVNTHLLLELQIQNERDRFERFRAIRTGRFKIQGIQFSLGDMNINNLDFSGPSVVEIDDALDFVGSSTGFSLSGLR